MDWLKNTTFHWRNIRSGHRPWLNTGLSYQGHQVRRQFFIDTGAGKSVAPMAFAAGLLKLDEGAMKDSGLMDAQGNPLIGTPVELELELRFEYPSVPLRLQETIWFCKDVKNGLLGQSTVLEQLGAIFLNFPQAREGRRFGLFLPPAALLQPVLLPEK